MPSGTNIGTAYVQILPSTQGISSGIASALTGGAAAGAATNAGGLLGGLLGSSMGQSIAKFIPGLSMAAATAGMVSFGRQSVRTGMEFDESMSQVYGLMASVNDGAGLTEAEMTRLRERAREMGSTTQYTAAQAADAMSFMALAGWDVEQVYSGIPAVLALAQASSMDLGRASDIVTDYMGAFSATAPTAEHLVDLLAYAQSNSNATTEQFAQSWQYSAGMMNAFGQSADTTTAILARLADQGHKASTGGVELNAVLTALYQGMDKKGDITFNGQLIHMADENGNFRNLIDVFGDMQAALGGNYDASEVTSCLDELDKALGDLDPESPEYAQKMAEALQTLSSAGDGGGFSPGSVGYITALSGLFGNVRGMRGIQAILNGDVNAMKEFEGELKTSDGTAQDVGKTMTDNLAGDLKILNSALDDLKISISDGLTPVLREFVQAVTPVVQWMANRLAGKTPLGEAAKEIEQLGQQDLEGIGTRIQELLGIVSGSESGSPEQVEALNELNELRGQIVNLDLSGEGENAVLGIAKGMTDYEFAGDASQVANGIISAIDNALLAHSPAQALVPSGTNAAAGIGLGMAQYDFTADSALIVQNIQGAITAGFTAADWSAASQATAQGIGRGILQRRAVLDAAARSLIASARSRVSSEIGPGGSKFQKFGKDLVSGIAAGVKANASVLTNAIKSAIDAALKGSQDYTDTHSPSRLFARELGQWIPKGIAKGITDNAYAMEDALTGPLSSMAGQALAWQPGDSAFAGRGFTQNVTINSPKALSPWEVARQTRNATRQMALSMR